MNFSMLHHVLPAYLNSFLQEIFGVCVGYIIDSENTLDSRIGALYCLFFVYQTQETKKKVKIHVSPELYQLILLFRVDLKRLEHVEGYQVLLFMSESHCFRFVARRELETNLSLLITPAKQMDAAKMSDLVSNVKSRITSLHARGDPYYSNRKEFYPTEEESNFVGRMEHALDDSTTSRAARIKKNRTYQIKSEIEIATRYENIKRQKGNFTRLSTRFQTESSIEGRRRNSGRQLKSFRETSLPTVLSALANYVPVKSEEECENSNNLLAVRRNSDSESSESEEEEETTLIVIEDSDSENNENDENENDLISMALLDPRGFVDSQSSVAAFSFDQIGMSKGAIVVPCVPRSEKNENLEEYISLNRIYDDDVQKKIALLDKVRRVDGDDEGEDDAEDNETKKMIPSEFGYVLVPSILQKRTSRFYEVPSAVVPLPLPNVIVENSEIGNERKEDTADEHESSLEPPRKRQKVN